METIPVTGSEEPKVVSPVVLSDVRVVTPTTSKALTLRAYPFCRLVALPAVLAELTSRSVVGSIKIGAAVP